MDGRVRSELRRAPLPARSVIVNSSSLVRHGWYWRPDQGIGSPRPFGRLSQGGGRQFYRSRPGSTEYFARGTPAAMREATPARPERGLERRPAGISAGSSPVLGPRARCPGRAAGFLDPAGGDGASVGQMS
ncbi:hypothetical protein FRAAL5162 [Frankia alni ACN14a]|uniref:Uncharacterized protein n=1 Tax=Frankia alni (strain DSM 45986 / CECT 9034 / ACN14a) TaxID=326424 RepID=Q0RFE3_FRAAA|nr:hypothetical protein FRAAL5162 [Frankia alni ACN14a]